ncbi:MAG: hypothetical protein J6L73_05255 [Muribaculaceae bacterium]|nr:hypothetical protein [Muribaculaceae bacterium]
MSTIHKFLLVVFALLWLGLAYLMLDLGGVTLYNILVALLAGALIFVPLWKRWKGQ